MVSNLPTYDSLLSPSQTVQTHVVESTVFTDTFMSWNTTPFQSRIRLNGHVWCIDGHITVDVHGCVHAQYLNFDQSGRYPSLWRPRNVPHRGAFCRCSLDSTDCQADMDIAEDERRLQYSKLQRTRSPQAAFEAFSSTNTHSWLLIQSALFPATVFGRWLLIEAG